MTWLDIISYANTSLNGLLCGFCTLPTTWPIHQASFCVRSWATVDIATSSSPSHHQQTPQIYNKIILITFRYESDIVVKAVSNLNWIINCVRWCIFILSGWFVWCSCHSGISTPFSTSIVLGFHCSDLFILVNISLTPVNIVTNFLHLSDMSDTNCDFNICLFKKKKC